jgi:predicted PurR-regulated permease PerM
MTKQLVLIGTAVMTTLLALVVFWQFRIVVVYMMISLMLAAALRPLVNRLGGKSKKIRVVWIILYLAVFCSFVYLLFLVSERTINEVQLFVQTVSVQDEWRLPVWIENSTLKSALTMRLPIPSKLFEAMTGNQGQLVLPAIFGFSQNIGNIGSDLVVILLLSVYWSISQVHFERLWLSLLPSTQRRQARGIWRKMEPVIGAYIRSQLLLSLLCGLLLGLGYWFLGSPYPVLLGVAGALVCLIPVVGAAFALFPPLLVGLLTSVQISLLTVIYTLAIIIILAIWVRPRLYDRKWDNSILTIILLIALADAFGIIGILLTPPLSIACQILWSRLVSHRHASKAAAQISDLRERQEHIWANIQKMEEPPVPLITSSMERLSLLLEKAEPILQMAILVDSSEVPIDDISQPDEK